MIRGFSVRTGFSALLMLLLVLGTSGIGITSYVMAVGFKVTINVIDSSTGAPVSGVIVFMDNIRKGTTNRYGQIVVRGVTPGYHTFTLTKTMSQCYWVNVYSDLFFTVRFWQGYTVLVRVLDYHNNVILSGVSVYFDGKKKGQTDRMGFLEIASVSPGTHIFELRKRSYCSIAYRYTVDSNVMLTLNMQRC
jgi:hypothetical protein